MKIFSYLIIVAGIFGYSSCQKHAIDKTAMANSVTVYAAGYVYDDTSNTATYWKNRTPVLLPPRTDHNSNSFAYSIAVSDSDIYVAGVCSTGVVYWKNGVPHELPRVSSYSGEANAITVSGNDVYVAGDDDDLTVNLHGLAVYWKNGNEVVLTDPVINASASGIVVSGSDVYVCGVTQPAGTYGYATYWKNGTTLVLTRDTVYSAASSIAVSGNDVYVAGNESVGGGTPVYWKNGHAVVLADASMEAGADAIAIVGNDVYVTGSRYNRALGISNAIYWKNGQMFYLTDRSSQSVASSIAVSGNDVYIGGMIATPNSIGTGYQQFAATYWKNGVPVTLPYYGGPGYRYVFSIFVKGK